MYDCSHYLPVLQKPFSLHSCPGCSQDVSERLTRFVLVQKQNRDASEIIWISIKEKLRSQRSDVDSADGNTKLILFVYYFMEIEAQTN